jgi:hypothetical protein
MSLRPFLSAFALLSFAFVTLQSARAQQSDLEELANLAMGLTQCEISRVVVLGELGGPLVAVIDLQGEPVELRLAPRSVRAPGFQLIEQRADGSLGEVDPGPVTTYRGEVVQLPGSSVAASLLPDGLYARFSLPDGTEYWLEPLASRLPSAGREQHVLYRRQDVLCPGHTCGSDHLAANLPKLAGGGEEAPPQGSFLGVQVAELACDGTYDFYQYWGSSIAGSNRIQSVIGAMNPQFESEVGISHEITTILIRTSASQPYTSTDPFTLFDQFRAEWNGNQAWIARDVAQLFIGPIPGSIVGIGAIASVCHLSDAYSMVQGGAFGSFMCNTDLSAHELGHNWSATHCTCTDSTMNPGITCTNTFSPVFSRPEIIAYRDSLTCLGGSGGAPPTVLLFSEGFERGSLGANGWSAQNNNASLAQSAAQTGSYGARLKKATWIERTVNTTGYAAIRLEYSRRTQNLDANERLSVEWWNGSAWQLVESTSATTWAAQAFVLDAAAGNNPGFRIRFRSNANQNNELCDVDNVRVIGS